jgi:phosphoribosylaminoimidazolecarboxamide formyltransferase/IMP cyclohydrolase
MSINTVKKIDDLVKVSTVLISVSDKTGLEDFVPRMVKANPNIRILSTGGTYKKIEQILGKKAEKVLTPVSEYTGQPETQGGLVKTLDFKIYLGLLTETHNPDHQADLKRTGAVPINMVVVNLYPFQQTIEAADVTPEKARGNIDIGGPCMIRAAAKNFIRVAPVVDPKDYPKVLEELESMESMTSLETRIGLAKKAFFHTAGYDQAIANYLRETSFNDIQGAYEEIL